MARAMWSRLAAFAAFTLAAAACREKKPDAQQAGDVVKAPMDAAEYTIVLKSRWTAQNFPFEYPAAGALTGPHFSGLIGATHSSSYSIFAEGTPPTPGLERLSEEGKHSPLDDEIRSAITSGSVGVLIETGPLRDFTDSVVTTVRVDPAHPFVSLVAMVAPSPDWFTGVANVNLMENGDWVASRTLNLSAYDSGGDDGTTYKAPDKDTNPKKPTSKNMSKHFLVNGQAMPVGTLTFTRK
jgi:hypothetical protein